MNDSDDPDDEPGQALVPADPAETALDAHGHDLSLYQWVPVLRKPRKDGWTPQRQIDFIAALADMACVEQAASSVGMSVTSCYRLRRESPQFAAAWDAALAHGARRLVDIAFDRAVHGTDEPVFDKEGRRVGRRMRQNDRLLMFLLRAYLPERFRYAWRDARLPHEPDPPAAPPLEEALGRLEPVRPPEPQKLMPPEELETALLCAEIGDGRLPHWHRGRGDAEPVPAPLEDPEFERMLENAKREAAGLPPLPQGENDIEGEDDEFLA